MGEPKRLACLAGVVFAAVLSQSGVAHGRALTAVSASGDPMGGSYQRWIDRSRTPTVRGKVRLVLTGCPARPRFVGCVYSRRLHTIYLTRGAPKMRSVLYHELGHLFDYRLLSGRERGAYKRLIGPSGRSWFGGLNPPAEQFAEGYALCARKRRIAQATPGQYGFRTSPRRHASVCALIRRAAGPAERPVPPKNPPAVTGPAPGAGGDPPPAPPPNQDESLLDQLVPG